MKVKCCSDDAPVRIIDIDVGAAARWFHEVVARRRNESRYDGTREKAAIALAKLYVQGRLSAGCFRRERRDASLWLAADIRMGAKGLLYSIAEGDSQDASLDAQYILGAVYREGIRDEEGVALAVQPDASRAKSLFEKAAEQRHVGAQNRLAVMLRDICGAGCERCPRDNAGCNLRRALELFRDASGRDPLKMNTASKVEWWNARINLGDMYDYGFGGPLDNDGHLEPYDPVAEYYRSEYWWSWRIPDPERELLLGMMYREGQTVDKDMRRAITCLCSAAQLVEEWSPEEAARKLERWGPEGVMQFVKDGKLERTVLLAVSRNGGISLHGFGVPIIQMMSNMDRPDDLWPVAEYALGDIYERGSYGERKDTVLAEVLYKSACSRYEDGSIGHARSEYKLARIYEREGRHSDARKWYLKAAERRRDGGCGHPGAQCRLGKMYEHGDRRYGCEKDGDIGEGLVP